MSPVAQQTFRAATDNWTQQGSQLTAFLVIGNVVGPSLLGTMVIAHVYILFLYAFVVDGFSEAVVQRQRIEAVTSTPPSGCCWDLAFWLPAPAITARS